jgi:hypothetical protein
MARDSTHEQQGRRVASRSSAPQSQTLFVIELLAVELVWLTALAGVLLSVIAVIR